MTNQATQRLDDDWPLLDEATRLLRQASISSGHGYYREGQFVRVVVDPAWNSEADPPGILISCYAYGQRQVDWGSLWVTARSEGGSVVSTAFLNERGRVVMDVPEGEYRMYAHPRSTRVKEVLAPRVHALAAAGKLEHQIITGEEEGITYTLEETASDEIHVAFETSKREHAGALVTYGLVKADGTSGWMDQLELKEVAAGGKWEGRRNLGPHAQFPEELALVFALVLRQTTSPERAGGSQPREWLRWDNRVPAVAYAPDGRWLASGGYDNAVLVWDAGTELERVLEGHIGPVSAVAYSPDQRRLASGSWDETVRVWDAVTGRCERVLEGHIGPVLAVAYAPDGRRLASGGDDYTVRVWDAVTGRCERVLPERIRHPWQGHMGGVSAVAYAPDGRWLASGSWDYTVRVWDAATGLCERVLEGHMGPVSAVAYAPDGRRLASGSWDNTLRVWDIESGKCLAVFPCLATPKALWFHPRTGELYAADNVNAPNVYILETGWSPDSQVLVLIRPNS